MSTTYSKINPREELKWELMGKRRVVGLDGQVHACEGQAYKKHTCEGGLHMHEAFVTRGDVQGVKPMSKRIKIITDERNCAMVCQHFHQQHAHTREFKEWFEDIQRERYPKLQQYLSRTWSVISKQSQSSI